MPRLSEFEGQEINLVITDAKSVRGLRALTVKLLNVDDGGIWVEDQNLMQSVLQELSLPAAPSSVAVFYTYAAIHAILATIPGLTLSEKAFGV